MRYVPDSGFVDGGWVEPSGGVKGDDGGDGRCGVQQKEEQMR